MRVGDVIELRTDAPSITENESEFNPRAKIKGKSQILSVAMVVKARGKTGSQHDFFPKKDVIPKAAADKKVVVCRNEKGSERAKVVAMDLPAVFDLPHRLGVGAINVEEARPNHEMRGI
jgi:hypothetical protein